MYVLQSFYHSQNPLSRPARSTKNPVPSGRAKPLWYTRRMTTADTKRIERIACESADLARKSLRKHA